MDTDNRHIKLFAALKIHHDIIVQDIQGDVIMALLQNQVLTQNEYEAIKSMPSREKEVCCLIDTLKLKGICGIHKFINYLSIYYSWISEPIERSILNEYTNGINTYVCSTKMKEVLNVGEVPQLSSRHVSRVEHVKSLKALLKNLEAGQFVVVNGMTGCGKSNLVAGVLNDILITMHYFEGFVQWINVGRENSSDVGCIQTEILNRLNNQEQLIAPPLSTNYKALRKTLRNLFKQKKITNGLLVLDDVYNNEIVKYLDIGCKILITTHDKSIMEQITDTRVKYLKVNEGFEEMETLDLFSKCLNVNHDDLPLHAKKLHKICKGFPLTISLIGAQLETHREETISKTDRWDFYLEELELSDKMSEPFKFRQNSYKQFKSLEKAIEMCIKSLPDDLQKNYQDFSLFVPDLNIKPEVLSVLWNLKKTQAEDIMLELIKKSLLVRVWNQPLNSYVYSIHDLLLNNLKNMMNEQESKLLHKKFIESYRTYCNRNFAELPKYDNYIFLYFGYHLKCADMLEEFPQWYLNLKFLESKIHATGPADLLADLRKYRKYIAVQSNYEEYIKEIEHFVTSIGPFLYQTKSDIVQLGLQEPETSFVYNESYKIAKTSKKSYFYYNIREFQNCLPEPHKSIVRDEIETVIFGNRHDEVIIATKSGSIKIWNIMSHNCLHTYHGHTEKVTYLVKNKLKTRFLSTSDDSTIRIWYMKSFSESDDSETRTPSPETRQEHWKNVFYPNYKKPSDVTDCIYILRGHSEPVIFAQFSSDDRLVVSSSIDKTLKIWKLDDNGCILHETIQQNSIIYKCYFLENALNDCIIFSTQTQTRSAIYLCKWPFNYCNGVLYPKEKLISFSPLPSIEGIGNFIVMTSNELGYYKIIWDEPISCLKYQYHKGYPHLKCPSISEGYTSKINNSRFLAFNLNNSTIKVCDLLTGYNYLDLNSSNQTILNIDWFWSKTEQSNWLLCAAEDKSIKLWCLNNMSQYTCAHQANSIHQSNKNEIISLHNYKLFSEEQNLYSYKLNENFHAVWLDNNSNVLIAAVTECGSLKILFDGLNQWSMVDKKVSALSIVHSEQKYDQTMIIVTCIDLSVYKLTFQTSQHLFDTSDEVEQMFTCFHHGDLIVAFLLKKREEFNQILQIKTNKRNMNVDVRRFIDCYVFHDKVILLHNIHEIMIVNLFDETKALLEINCIRVNGTLMLDHSTLAVTDNANNLSLFKITTDLKLKQIYKHVLPFKQDELTFLSLSNNKHLIAISGQTNVVLFDTISKIITNFTIDPWVNNIQSVVWSSDNTRLAIKEDNQIILFDVEFGKKIASIRLTAKKFLVDSTFKTFIAVNTTGQLVMLNLFSNEYPKY